LSCFCLGEIRTIRRWLLLAGNDRLSDGPVLFLVEAGPVLGDAFGECPMTQVSLSFTREEYASRLWKVRAEMASRGIDVLVISDPSNMAWLTGYDGWSFYVHQCVLVGLEGEPVWYGRRMDANGALRTCWIDPDNITYYPDYYVQNPDMHPMDYLAQSIMPDRGWHQGVV